MDFENKLITGVLIKRYKRFFADIKLKNKIVTAHCPNPGSMINLLKEGNPVWITKSKLCELKISQIIATFFKLLWVSPVRPIFKT